MLEFIGADSAIVVPQVSHHGQGADVGIAKSWVLNCLDVNGWDGFDELLA